jgi:hypothetical protein
MKTLLFALLLSGSFLLAQDNPAPPSQQGSTAPKGQVTVQGCVSRSSGDFILMKSDPAVTYELQATGKIKLSKYLGQQVEATGTESPSMSTSSDTSRRSASSVTLSVTSVRTLAKECPAR